MQSVNHYKDVAPIHSKYSTAHIKNVLCIFKKKSDCYQSPTHYISYLNDKFVAGKNSIKPPIA